MQKQTYIGKALLAGTLILVLVASTYLVNPVQAQQNNQGGSTNSGNQTSTQKAEAKAKSEAAKANATQATTTVKAKTKSFIEKMIPYLNSVADKLEKRATSKNNTDALAQIATARTLITAVQKDHDSGDFKQGIKDIKAARADLIAALKMLLPASKSK